MPVIFQRRISMSGAAVSSGLLYPNFPYDPTRSISSGSLYVDPVSGSSGNNGLSQGAAKATIAQAVAALGTSSSKIIYLMNGTHTIATAVSLTGDGTSGTPIQLTSLPGHTPTIDCNQIYRTFKLDGVAWWRISHLTVTNWGNPGNGDDGAFMIGENATTSNTTFFCIDGTTGVGGDNYALIHTFGQRATGMTYDRLRIRFTGNSATAHQNTAGLYIVRLTGTGTIDINHCDISGFPMGIYHKHGEEGRTTLSGGTVSNSIITASNRLNIGYNPAGWLYTNVVLGTGVNEIYLAEEDGGPAGDANQFFHCTFYTGLRLRNQGDGANNNRLTNCVIRSILAIELGSITSTSDYNAWGSGNIINGGALAAWRTFNSSDAHSVQGTLTFTNGADVTLPSYYQLTSTGIAAASDGTDMGANTTTVGVQSP